MSETTDPQTQTGDSTISGGINEVMDEGFQSFDEVVNQASQLVVPVNHPLPNESLSVWKHGGYMLMYGIWQFFTGPQRIRRVRNKDNRFKFIAEQIISTLPDNSDPVVIESTKKLLDQHRTIEDTEARRRLERWACRIIIWYLVFVFVLTILNGLSQVWRPCIFREHGFISDTVMYVLLSTTTVNIIGLGLIVLRGHFPSEEKKKKNDGHDVE